MDKQQARTLIKETFEQPFEKARFTVFVKNLLNRCEDAPFTYIGQYIPSPYAPYISTLERIAKFSDGEHSLDVLIIKLKKETSLERARTMQRNFVAWYLNGSRGGTQKDAALVAFVSPEKADWRFSLVKMDYKFTETKTGTMKVKEEFTPARRWSFLVGTNEKSHTAQSRLINILANDEHPPTLAELEEAFNIETVTKEFFLRYRDLFIRTKEALDKIVRRDPQVRADFETKNVNTVDFAKKLLGQIVFLYFLQKKGWLGVKKHDQWGDGSKQFLRELLDGKHCAYKNFFNDILEPLFYDALSRDRSDIDHWNDHFQCKIPFLNGGLFDPIGNYSWHGTDVLLPNDLFSHRKTGMDEGTGILDVFDLYNFTVKEDEPMEREVAIDPELLGKAYERFNAIRPDNFEEYKEALKSGKKGDESKFNKQFGVYYTPREIVHYMCQESLINYLASEFSTGPSSSGQSPSIPREDIETLIYQGEQLRENEARVESRGESGTYSFQLPESIRKNAKAIDEKLADIAVCDPAVGSGAFPVGMMAEVVKARNVLTTFITEKNRTSYDFKRRCIQHSLYGVDIDPGAVEIAKLRLWLSLVVDEDDISQIKPLPNLDYKIMQGNSLLEEYEGIKLFDENLIAQVDSFKEKRIESLKQRQTLLQREYFELHAKNKLSSGKQLQLAEELKSISTTLKKLTSSKESQYKDAGLFDVLNEAKQKAKLLRQLQKQFFETSVKHTKDELKKRIEKLEWELIEATLKEEGKVAALKKVDEFKKSNTKPFFLWKLHFSEVFQDKGGFNVVIGNPPYLNVELVPKEQKEAFARLYKTFYKRYDVFGLFFELSLTSLVPIKGTVAFIIPQQIFNNLSYKKLRYWFLDNKWLREVFYLGDKIFEDANNDVCVLFLAKPAAENIKLINALDFNKKIVTEVPSDHFKKYDNIISFSHDRSGETIFNKIFDPKHSRIKDDYDVFQGIVTGNNAAYLPTKEQIAQYKIEATLLRPVLLGRDFEKWLIRSTDRRILYIDGKSDIKKYPNAEVWLSQFQNDLKKRRECVKGIIPWYSLQWPRDKSMLDRVPKILVQGTRNPRLRTRIVATVDEMCVYGTQGLNFIVPKAIDSHVYFILGILNSRLINYLYATKFLNVAIKAEYLKNTPIPIANKVEKTAIIKLVQNILSETRYDNYHQSPTKISKVYEYEREIDTIVYSLYGLSENEIEAIESENDIKNLAISGAKC